MTLFTYTLYKCGKKSRTKLQGEKIEKNIGRFLPVNPLESQKKKFRQGTRADISALL
jgi:hypothetical protein